MAGLPLSDNGQLPDNGTTNGHAPPQLPGSDIEITGVKSVSYTSLRDLIPTSSSSWITSPTHNASWQEIPIRNPLVKQAALSYLQPMSSAPEADDKGVFERVRDACASRPCGCFTWLHNIVLVKMKLVFGADDGNRTFWIDDEEDFNQEEEEEEDEDRDKG